MTDATDHVAPSREAIDQLWEALAAEHGSRDRTFLQIGFGEFRRIARKALSPQVVGEDVVERFMYTVLLQRSEPRRMIHRTVLGWVEVEHADRARGLAFERATKMEGSEGFAVVDIVLLPFPPATLPQGVSPALLEEVREGLRCILACTPHVRDGEIIYDCGDPFGIARTLLSKLTQPGVSG